MQGDLLVSDLELVEKVKAGDRKSFSELVKRHQRGVLRLSLRFVKDMDAAEDVTQDAFIKAYEKLSTFEGRASFKSWLFQIAVNTARNKLREWKKNTVDVDDVQLAVAAEAETTLVHGAVANLLQQEVDKLPHKQKTALVLRVYEDLSFNEIAEIMECPYDTAKANYRHALIKLRQTFEQQSELKNWTEEVGGFFMEVNHAYAEAKANMDMNRFDRTDKVRKGLKAADDFEMQMSEDFFDRLHDKIMAEVEQTEIKPQPMLMTPRNLLRAHWRGWLYPLGGVASLFLFTSMLLGQVSKVNQSMQRVGLLSDGHERIVAEALLDPADMSQTLISSQNESDFFVDVAAESFENLSVTKVNQLMGEGRR